MYLKEVPLDSRAVVEFSYDDKGECFIKSCVLESVWKDVPLEKWPFTNAPSRKEPGKNRLIEKEAFSVKLVSVFQRIYSLRIFLQRSCIVYVICK